MKKILFTSVFIVSTLIFCIFSVYFAYAANQENILATNAELTDKTNRVLSILEKNSVKSDSAVPFSTAKNENYSIVQKENEISKKNFYNVKSKNYSFNYTSDTLELVNIFNTSNNFGNISTADESSAREFILGMYSELSLPVGYELTYLAKLDDSLWEADFSQKYGDIYNKYESVKIFFSPDLQEIAALTIFNEKAVVSARSTTISETDARNIVIETLNVPSDKILSVSQGFERANGLYSNETLDLTKKVYNVWIVNYEFENTTASCFIDINSGNIIGGAIQK